MLSLVTTTNNNKKSENLNHDSLLIHVTDTLYLYKNVKNFDPKNDSEKFEYKHTNPITTCVHLPCKNLIVFTDLVNKTISVLDCSSSSGSIRASQPIQKRAAKLIHAKDESLILIGDKHGDVYSANLTENKENNEIELSEPTLLMGHLSTCMDLGFVDGDDSSGGKFRLITSDRDEKIRVTAYPNTYNIVGYLLGHNEFVSCVKQLEQPKTHEEGIFNHFISASGDLTLKLWKLNEKDSQVKCLQTFDLKKLAELKPVTSTHKKLMISGDESDELVEDNDGIVKFVFDRAQQNFLVQTYHSSSMLLFKLLNDEGKLRMSFVSAIKLDDQDVDFDTFARCTDDDHFIFVRLASKESKERFTIRKLVDNKLVEEPSVRALEASIQNTIQFEADLLVTQLKKDIDREFQGYFKAKVNNMQYYYDRKNQRIAEAAAVQAKHQQNVLAKRARRSEEQEQEQEQKKEEKEKL